MLQKINYPLTYWRRYISLLLFSFYSNYFCVHYRALQLIPHRTAIVLNTVSLIFFYRIFFITLLLLLRASYSDLYIILYICAKYFNQLYLLVVRILWLITLADVKYNKKKKEKNISVYRWPEKFSDSILWVTRYLHCSLIK